MCPIAATFFGLVVGGAIVLLGLPIFLNGWDSVRRWLKSRPRTNSFGPGVTHCKCEKVNFGGGPG